MFSIINNEEVAFTHTLNELENKNVNFFRYLMMRKIKFNTIISDLRTIFTLISSIVYSCLVQIFDKNNDKQLSTQNESSLNNPIDFTILSIFILFNIFVQIILYFYDVEVSIMY